MTLKNINPNIEFLKLWPRKKMSWPRILILCALAAFCYFLGNPIKETAEITAPWRYFLTLLPLIGHAIIFKLFFNQENKKSRIYIILTFVIITSNCSFSWVAEAVKVFGEIPFPANHLVSFLHFLVFAPRYFALYFLTLWTRIESRFLIAIFLTLFEGLHLQIFPNYLGHSWAVMAPYLFLAPVFGASIYSFCGYMVSLYPEKKITYLGLFLFVAIHFLFPLAPPKNPNELEAESINIRVVQGNIGNNLKRSFEVGAATASHEIASQYMFLSRLPSPNTLDLIIWPETAYPYILSSKGHKNGENIFVPGHLKSLANKHNLAFLFGTLDEHFPKIYNAIFMIEANHSNKQVYHKQKLLPFAEALPFGPLNHWLYKMIPQISNFARGENNQKLFHLSNKNLYFSTNICYEILFSDFIRTQLKNAKHPISFLVNLTNDGWFGPTSEPHQHLFLAKWRSMEFGVPTIRSTNTGITSIILSNGTEGKRIPQHQMGNLDYSLTVEKRPKITIYQRFGLLPLFILWLLMAFCYQVRRFLCR